MREVTSNGDVEQMGGGGFEFTVYDVGTEQNITCPFEDGMTQRQWVESDYNTINLAVQGNFIVSADNPTYLVLNVGDESEGYIQENVHPKFISLIAGATMENISEIEQVKRENRELRKELEQLKQRVA